MTRRGQGKKIRQIGLQSAHDEEQIHFVSRFNVVSDMTVDMLTLPAPHFGANIKVDENKHQLNRFSTQK